MLERNFAKMTKISPNNKCVMMMRARRLKIEELRKKCKANREEVDDFARRVFVHLRRDEVPSLVAPIIEDIIGTAVSFGHGRNPGNFHDFQNRPSSPDFTHRFSSFKKLRPSPTGSFEDNTGDAASKCDTEETVEPLAPSEISRPVQV